MSSATAEKGRLLQILGVAFGVAVIIGNTIGVGILRTPGDIAERLPSVPLFLSVWVAVGIYALLGAINLSELGAMLPRSGGQYVFVSRGLGPLPGFVVGWSDWMSNSGTAAAISIVFGEYAVRLLPALAGRETLLALGAVLVFTIVLWQGARTGDRTQQATSLLKALGLMTVAVACLLLPAAPLPAAEARPVPTGGALLIAIVVSLQAVIYTFDGWTGALYFSGEVKDPGREIPRATLFGVGAVLLVYLFLNAAFLKVVGIERMAGDSFVAGTAARAVFGPAGDTVVSIVVIISMLSAVNAILLMASRVPYAMAQDGLLPPRAAEVSASGTPRVTLVASSAVAAGFIVSGTFNQVLAVLSFFFVLSYSLSFTTVFVLRRREPDTPRPYRAWGYPWTTATALVGSLAYLGSTIAADREGSIWSLTLLGLSVPAYFLFRRFGRAAR